MGMRAEVLSQSLSDARAVGLGAYAPLISDSRAFSINPAGLAGVRDWETAFSTYMITTSTDAGIRVSRPVAREADQRFHRRLSVHAGNLAAVRRAARR